MQRIVWIIFRMFFEVIYYISRFNHFGKEKYRDYAKAHEVIASGAKRAIKVGRIIPKVEGVENIPEKDGFIFYPNHQGMFDVFMFYYSCRHPFAFVLKKEAAGLPIVKGVISATGSLAMDRSDLRQSVKVINEVSERVKNGSNFIIFAEGTRSRMGNKLLDFKGGSFKAATNACCPIIPVMLKDSFRPFDEKGIKKVEVTIKYLPPIQYEEYKNMKGQEIAKLVRERIQNELDKEDML